jgi:ADP-heptose:LPS heptosyltransferase
MVKFLIIRFSSIGDIVLTTPIVRCLKNHSEEFQVHYLTKLKFVSILEANPYIDKIHVLNKNFNELIKELKTENFDYVIDLHRNIRTLRVKNSLKRFSFTFNKLNLKKWLIVNFKIDRLPDLHIVDRYFDAVKVFSIENDGQGLDYFIKKDDEISSSAIPDFPKKPFIVVVVGGGHNTKQIPQDKLFKIIDSQNTPIILIGGKEDISKAENIQNSLSNKTVNLTGKLTLGQSAAIIKKAALILTPDTGMMHIAAAFKKNIFSIWGNTIPEFGMFPYLPGSQSEIFEIKGLSCRPCSKIGFNKCPKKHFNCMNNQDYNKISQKLTHYFNESTINNKNNLA